MLWRPLFIRMAKPVKMSHATSLPNLLTYGRIAAVPAILLCAFSEDDWARWVSVLVFIAAGITDYFDGYLARALDQQSSLGRMLDPIADKLLVAVCLLILVYLETIGGLSLIAAAIILSREILVSGLREFLADLRVSVPVTWLAKWKTTVQMVAIGVLLACPAGDRLIPNLTGFGTALLWLAAALTLYTGWDYFRSSIHHVIDNDG